MLSTQKFGIAITGILLCCAAVILPADKSIANPVFSSNYTQVQFDQVKLSNIEIGNNKSISCLIQQRSPLMNTFELLMRLLIIGSFGSVSVAGSSSLMQRYLHILNRDYIVIVYCVVGLVLIMVMSSVAILFSSSTYQVATPRCPTNTYSLVSF